MDNNSNEFPDEFQINSATSSGGEGFDLIKFIHVLKRSLLVLGVVFPMIFGIAFLYVRYTKPMFESQSVIKLKEKSESQVLGLKAGRQGQGNISTLSGEIEIIKSQMIFNKLIEKLGLELSYYEYGKFLNDEKFGSNAFYVEYDKGGNSIIYDRPIDITFENQSNFTLSYTANNEETITKKAQVGDLIDLNGFAFKVGRKQGFSDENVKVPYFFRVNSQGSLFNYIRKSLQVSILNPSAKTIQIKFQDHNSIKSANIVNAIDSIYLESTLETKRLEQEQVISYINQQLDNTAKSLESSEIKLEDFVRKSGTDNPSSDFGAIKDRLVALNDEKLALKLEGELLDEIRKSLLSDSSNSFVPTISNLDNPQLKSEIQQLNDSYKDLSKLVATTSTNTLAYKRKVKEVESLENSVLEYVFENRKILLEGTYAVNEKINTLHEDFLGLPSKNTELTRLKRFYNLWEKFYLLLIEKRVEYGIMKAGAVPEFIILSPASFPGLLVYPLKLQVYTVAFILALLLTLVVVGVKYVFHNKILSISDLERNLRTPVLGMIPEFTAEKLEHSSLVIHKYPKSAVTEALRSIRTNLDFVSPNQDKRLLTVTSTVSGEGKTFVAINTGGILAISGQKVVVLDLDMRKPKIHLGFGSSNEEGMSTLLIKRNTLDECIKKSELENLDFISAGPLPPNPAELIMTKEFDDLIDELYTRYDVVIIDTPPVGLVTDGLLVMKRASIPIYVVRSGYSEKRVDKNINNLYDSGRFKNLSVVLNAVEKVGGNGYGYGYGYGYGGQGYYEEE